MKAVLRSLFRRTGNTEPASRTAPRDHEGASTAGDRTVEDVHRLTNEGRLGEALALVDTALAATPVNADLVLARASTLFEWGRHRDALPAFVRAESLGSTNFNLYLRAGWSAMRTAGAAAAEPWMRKATAAEPNEWTGHFGLASVLRGLGRTADAVSSLEIALELSPGNLHCLAQLSDCMLTSGRPDAAERYARASIAANASTPVAWSNLGVALTAQERYEEARAAFEHAERMAESAGEPPEPHVNLGNCLREVGALDESIALYARRLPTNPAPAVHIHHAHALFTAGRLGDGFVEYEFRWMHPPLVQLRPSFRKPVWDGQPLAGRTILLRTEQGIGDAIQFIRYAPHVKALGATVLLQARRGIGELARGFRGIDRILGVDDPYPEFDYYIHLASLPRVFGTEADSVPAAVPYIDVDPERRSRWSRRVGGDGFKVGLVWAGDANHLRDKHRSVPLAALAPLAAIENVRFFSLQKGESASQLASAPPGMRIDDLGPELEDFADTAAAIVALDLVVSVDTSVAHLAGALGKPVWMLVPTPADWRWMVDRDDTPWYPTMRLFRQHRRGDWQEVVGRVRDTLADEASGRARGTEADSLAAGSSPPPKELLAPLGHPRHSLPGLCAVAETIAGVVEYFPEETIVGDSIAAYGEYRHADLMLLARLMRPGATVLEVNAGVGMHALPLARALGDAGHVYVYEARPLHQQVLRQNLSANAISNVTLIARLLGGACGDGLPRGDDTRDQASAARTPMSDTVDDLRLDALHWLKVMPGGDPMEVLRGAEATLWRLRPSLFVAAPDEPVAREIARRLADFGYRSWRVAHPYFRPDNFNLRDRDVFGGAAALAVLAIPEEGQLAPQGYVEFGLDPSAGT